MTQSSGPLGIDGFTNLASVARVEMDRFCERCGYNLRGQQVRRDPRTSVLMAVCPECGHYHAATDQTLARHIWLRRFGVILMVGWVLSLIGAYLILYSILASICFSTIEYVQRAERQNPKYYYSSHISDHDLYMMLLGCSIGAAVIGAVTTFAAVLFFPHWRRWGYHALAGAGPAMTGWFVAGVIYIFDDAPYRLSERAIVFVMVELLACFTFAMAMAFLGRIIARGIVRLLVPPRLRPMLSYLWIADGKEPPSVKP